jgi:hypothetical protein
LSVNQDIAHTITQQGAAYVLALTENHPTLYENVTLFMQDAKALMPIMDA